MRFFSSICVIIFLFLCCYTIQAEQNDEVSLLLDLKKAKANYDMAKQKYEDDQRLYNEHAISENEVNKSKNKLLSYEVDYQKLILQLITHQFYVVVEQAVKYQVPNGNKRVKITLRSASEGNAMYLEQLKEHVDIFSPELYSGKIYNIFVSIMDVTNQIIVGSPYEYHIPMMDIGGEVTADFGLLKDVESIQVSLTYNNKHSKKNIYLRKDASTNMIDISSTQFSQEADLSSSVTYDLFIERFSTSDDIYKLVVLNLPQQITYDFIDDNSKISQIKFGQGVNHKKISLKIYLPERGDETMKIDEAVRFYVIALTNEDYTKFSNMGLVHIEQEQIRQLPVRSEQLELIPRGKSKIELRVPSFYYEIYPSDSIIMNITVRNVGSRRLDNIKISADIPANWKIKVTPNLIRTLDPEKEQQIHITVIQSFKNCVGAHEIRINAEALTDNRKVSAEEKTIRIQVNAATPIWGTLILLVVLIGMIVGSVIFGLKLSRR